MAKSQQTDISLHDWNEQKKFMEMDYHRYSMQGGPKSLYFISKLAKSVDLKINIPPTIVMGFKDHGKLMWNCYKTGKVLVKSGFVTTEQIHKFVSTYMHQFYMSQV